ncbi:MAG: polyphosphate kinase 2 [Candidatus Hodarchaeales archaeon]|jgi:polyphosphate kinase 2
MKDEEKFPSYEEVKEGWLNKKFYKKELARLQNELVKMQYWIKHTGYRLLLTFDGRDAAGKGGVIKRIIQPLNPRGVRLVALPAPSDREKTQWFFQRYASHLPAAGEIVLFDRSWYNRAVVERVMGFCSEEEYWDFLNSSPLFESMITKSGIKLVKYWLSVSQNEQERRFQARAKDSTRRWKLSSIDLASRKMWDDYSKAKDNMIKYTDKKDNRCYHIEADDKFRARLNCIRNLLEQVPYEDVTPKIIKLPPRPKSATEYVRPSRKGYAIVKDFYKEIN